MSATTAAASAATAAAASSSTTAGNSKPQQQQHQHQQQTMNSKNNSMMSTNNNNNNKKTVQVADESDDEPPTLATPGFVLVKGPVDPRDTLIVFDIPLAPLDPKKSVRLRQRLSLAPEPENVESRVVDLIDRLIHPREWIDENSVRWEQHASPYPSPRADVVRTQAKLQTMMKQQGARETGICHIRSGLYAECFLEVLRQTIAENWERGLLLLSLHSHICERQQAHRELFESRVGFSFRLALCSDRDVAAMRKEIKELEVQKEKLAGREVELKEECRLTEEQEIQRGKEDEKMRADEIIALKKEANQKRAILEVMTQPTHRNI